MEKEAIFQTDVETSKGYVGQQPSSVNSDESYPQIHRRRLLDVEMSGARVLHAALGVPPCAHSEKCVPADWNQDAVGLEGDHEVLRGREKYLSASTHFRPARMPL